MKKHFLTVIALVFTTVIMGQEAAASLDLTGAKTIINRNIYGMFSEHLGKGIYGGIWVPADAKVKKSGRIRLDVVDALKEIAIPNLRWPGGCFADEYHWMDGIGDPAKRPKMVNTNWGNVTEDNSFGTEEFMKLCKLLNTSPYISGNLGSGSVQEMSNWVEYLNFDGISPMTKLRASNGVDSAYGVQFFGVGNESWGCGGNMTPEYYVNEFKRYATFTKNYKNAPLKRIASGANVDDYHWTEVCMKDIPHYMMWGLSLHYYTIPTGNWDKKGSATGFSEAEYFQTMKNCLKMEELVTRHAAIMDKYDPKKEVALVVDEWGIWTDPEPGTNPAFLYQQNSLRDALIAATTLNIFNNHADRVRMANLAQTVNVLQSLILTDEDQMVLTPTYYVFKIYKAHQSGRGIPLKIRSPDYTVDGKSIAAVNGSASLSASGELDISLVNLDAQKDIKITLSIAQGLYNKIEGKVLTSKQLTDVNTFNQKLRVHPVAFSAFNMDKGGKEMTVDLPKHSLVNLHLQ